MLKSAVYRSIAKIDQNLCEYIAIFAKYDSSLFESVVTVGQPHQFCDISIDDNGRASGIPYRAHGQGRFCLARRTKPVRFFAVY